MKKIVIIGAGGHGQVVADALILMNDAEPVAFLDDNPEFKNKKILGIPVSGGNEELCKLEHDGVVIAVGNNSVRKQIFNKLKNSGEHLFSVVHPGAIVSPAAKIGEGCMILAGAVVNTGAEIGNNTILNTNCTVEHHNIIGPHVHIAPGSTLGGEVIIEEGAMIGIGATVLPRTKIFSGAMLGAGSTALKDIPPNMLAIGNPARCIKKNSS